MDEVKCEDCKYHSYDTIERTDMDGKHVETVIVCDLGFRIGLGGSPIEECEYKPME